MDIIVPTKIIIRWRTRDDEAIAFIRKRFALPVYTTFNGWTPGILKPEDKEVMDECARRGFLNYREAEWSYNGVTYSW